MLLLGITLRRMTRQKLPLVTRVVTLRQGEKSILAYANELSDIYCELDHYRPPDLDSADKEYVLMDRVYKLLQGL